jgi:trehalose 6-phosphate phosphatase
MATDDHIHLGMIRSTSTPDFNADALPSAAWLQPGLRPNAQSLLLNGRSIALFLDFDGTLAEIAPHPDAVTVTAATRQLLAQMQAELDGAVAIITGREVATIDRHLAPLRLAVAGVHGLIRRDAAGDTFNRLDAGVAARLPGLVDAAAAPLLSRHPELAVEYKTGAVALHFRGAPDQAAACVAVMQAIADQLPDAGVRLCHGRQVVEIVAGHSDKGTAVAAYLAEPPFHGRVPVFIGDDATDEDGFTAVNRAGGLSVKVGDGTTVAHRRLADPSDVFVWLSEVAALLD